MLRLFFLLTVIVSASTAKELNPSGKVRFAMHCRRLVSARVDPDTFPGECSSHVHDAFGAATWNPEVERSNLNKRFEDDDGVFRKTKTTCAHPSDRSMYWNPSLYLRARACAPSEQPGENGCGMLHLATPTRMTAYYKDKALSLGTEIKRTRDRLRMLPKAFRIRVDPAAQQGRATHRWTCKGIEPATGEQKVFVIRNTAAQSSWRSFIGQDGAEHCNTLSLRVPFPPCFKSRDASPDSGVKADKGGLCPSGYNFRFPEIQYNVEWNMTHIFDIFNGNRDYCDSWDDCMSRLVSGNQDDTGEAFHAVFINGWNTDVLRESMKSCVFRPGGAEGPDCPLREALTEAALKKAKNETGSSWVGKERQHQLPGRMPIENVETIPDLLTNTNSPCNTPFLSANQPSS